MEERIRLIEEEGSEALGSIENETTPKPPDRWAKASEDEIREFQEKIIRIKEASYRLTSAFTELYFKVGGMR